MAEPTDQQWLDILAGRTGGRAPKSDTPDAREAVALRNAILATRDKHEAGDHDVEAGVQRLLFRLRREGLISESNRRSWFAWSAFAIAAMLMLVIGLVTLLAPQDDVPVYRGSGAQSLSVADTTKTAAVLRVELEALGLKPNVTRFGDNITVQVAWPESAGTRHKAFLRRHNLKQPASGPLVIELTPRAGGT